MTTCTNLRQFLVACTAVMLLPATTLAFGAKEAADVALLSRSAMPVDGTTLTAEQCVLIQVHSDLPHGLWSSPGARFESGNEDADCASAPQRVPVRRTVPTRRADDHS